VAAESAQCSNRARLPLVTLLLYELDQSVQELKLLCPIQSAGFGQEMLDRRMVCFRHDDSYYETGVVEEN
jgi:hypothetical protein